MQLVDGNKYAASTGENRQEGYYNYFLGNDQTKWASNVPLYGNVVINEIYPGINVKYYFDGSNIRYDYIVKPGADISKLRIKFEGQESVRINESGELVIKTSLGEVTNGKLYSYQNSNDKQYEIACGFKQNQDGSISLSADNYDKTKDLIIDPLIYSTFIGGGGEDRGLSIKTNPDGNAFITGYTDSQNFPTTPGAYQTTSGGIGYADAFVTKLNQTGSSLIFSTFIGGKGGEQGNSITLDISGNSYITGCTNSSNFPTTPGAFQTNNNGSLDVFITKLNSAGTSLIYSTLLGSNNSDMANSISIDANENAYVAGRTESPDFPTTSGAFQTTSKGSVEGFVSIINPSGNSLVYSTFIGGSGDDTPNSIVVDNEGKAYITGSTGSSNYPVTTGALQSSLSGSNDGFVTKINTSGSALVYSTYLGGTNFDWGSSIAIDMDEAAYITGNTNSTDYPTTSTAYMKTYGGGSNDGFITKLNSAGNALVYSTFIGGNSTDYCEDIKIDSDKNAYVTGYTSSLNFPTTERAFQRTYGGERYDIFISTLNPTGNALGYSTYLGGNGMDEGFSLSIDGNKYIYVTGHTWASQTNSYPTTPGAFQSTCSYVDIVVSKLAISFPTPTLYLTSPVGGENWLAYSMHNISWVSSAYGNCKVEYSTDNGTNWILITNSAVLDSGVYHWTIPHTLSMQCKVKVTALDGTGLSGVSDSTFTISYPSSSLYLTSPIGGEHWDAYTEHDISWSSGSFGNCKIEYSIDNGTNWTTITNSAALNTEVYRWTIPNTPSTHCKVKMTALDGTGLSDMSDSTFTISQGTGIKDDNLIPLKNALNQNYPNPFNPQTTICYSVVQESNVVIKIFDILGKEVAKLVNEDKKAGTYNVLFNASVLSSGMYFYTIQANSADGKQSFRETKKMLLLK